MAVGGAATLNMLLPMTTVEDGEDDEGVGDGDSKGRILSIIILIIVILPTCCYAM